MYIVIIQAVCSYYSGIQHMTSPIEIGTNTGGGSPIHQGTTYAVIKCNKVWGVVVVVPPETRDTYVCTLP